MMENGTKPPSRQELRKFSIGLVVVTAVVGSIWIWRDHDTVAKVFFGITAWSAVAALIAPGLIRPLHWLLGKVGFALGWFNTRLILVLIFYLIFTPIGLILRLFGKDLLYRKIDRSAKSYWVDRKPEPFDPKRYERQF